MENEQLCQVTGKAAHLQLRAVDIYALHELLEEEDIVFPAGNPVADISGVKGGSIHSRFQAGGILYQITWNQVDVEAFYPGMNIRMLCIFLLIINGHEPCHLQSSGKISIWRHPQKYIQIVILR